MIIFDSFAMLTDLDSLKSLKQYTDDERPPNSLKISECLLTELVEYYDETLRFNPHFDIMSEPGCCSPCACLGPKPGSMWCPCRLRTALYDFRFDVLIAKQTQTHLD